MRNQETEGEALRALADRVNANLGVMDWPGAGRPRRRPKAKSERKPTPREQREALEAAGQLTLAIHEGDVK